MSLTIFKRMAAAHLVIMGFVLFMGAYVAVTLGKFSEINREVAQVDGFIIRTGERMQEILFSLLGFEKKYVITGDADFYREFGRMVSLFREEMEKVSVMQIPWEKSSLMKKIEGSFEIYGAMPVQLQGGRQELERREVLADEINTELRKIIVRARMERDRKVAQSDKIAYRAVRVITGTAALTVIVGVLLSFFMTRGIVRPIHLLKNKTREIAKGKFQRIPPGSSPPEIKALAEDFNVMSDRLKEMDDLKKEFISHVSHELRTPLTSIKAASGMLSEGTFKISPEKEREILRIIQSECDRLIGNVNRLLDLSRMEAKMMDYQFQEGDLAGVIRSAALKLAPLSQKKKIRLETEPLPVLDRVRMDPDRITQVIENLLGNALKYTPENGKIRIEASLNGESGFVRVSVSDTGIGIPRESLDQIFEPFQRVKARKGTTGTGLGLSIAKHIVADHGGRIWAESTPGSGSTFSFTLPLA
jgi:two-component system, NtrC family, sensor histidine kinase GlrK